MRATYDPQVQALYVYVGNGDIVRTEERGGPLVDLAEDGSVVGYEFLLSEALVIHEGTVHERET